MNVRLLPYEVADGAHNMAADEALLQTAMKEQIASLRFYGWTAATVSLGYFEAAASRHAYAHLAQLPWVRRPTGGGTLVHHHEVTYAVAMPPNSLWRIHEPSILAMHSIIAAALVALGVKEIAPLLGPAMQPSTRGLCFERHSFGDLLCHDSKIVGSAQRKHRRALLQHGGILLAQSEYTPSLPGLHELAGFAPSAAQIQVAVAEEFTRQTGWSVVPGKWSPPEQEQTEVLSLSKYASPTWNKKR